jgi:hypothetical protein
MHTLYQAKGEIMPSVKEIYPHYKNKPAEHASCPVLSSFAPIPAEDAGAIAAVGVHPEDRNRSATMIVRDLEPVYMQSQETQNFEMLPISLALKRYAWLRERFYFRAISQDFDEVSAECAKRPSPPGVFIHVKKGVSITLPCQAAMYLASENLTQAIHNIVILEEGAQLQLITGCVSKNDLRKGRHLSVEEYYIGKNAKLISTMVHSWSSEVLVNPRAGAIVDENGRYESNYISLKAARSIKSNPQTYLNGRGASAKHMTVVLGTPGSVIETAGNVFLNAPDTGAELLHRGVCTGGIMRQGGLLIGNAACKAHVDCAGMLLDQTGQGYIESIPGLRSHHPDARMSHEASIGKIAPDQVEYLMSRGMDEPEAISMLIRGFLLADIEGLGPELDAQIADIAAIAGHGEGQ